MPGDLLRISDLTTSTPVKIDLPDGSISLSVDDVMKWVAPNAPPHEAMRLLVISRICRLDPFRREVHLVPFTNKQTGATTWSLVIDKAGWLRMAEDHLDKFDGHQSGVVIRDLDGTMLDIEGEIVPKGCGVIGGWAKVYRKDRRYPTVCRVGSECVKDNNPQWQTNMPFMYRKTALVHSLRESGLCFGLGGLYDKGEVVNDFELSAEPINVDFQMSPKLTADYQSTPLPNLSPNIAHAIEAAMETLNVDDYRRQVILAKRGVSHVAELSDQQGLEILSKLNEKIDSMNAGQIMLPDKPDVVEPIAIADDEYVDEHGEVRKKEEVAHVLNPDEPKTVRLIEVIDDDGHVREIMHDFKMNEEIPERVMDEIDSEEFDPITRRDDDEPVSTNFGIEIRTDDSDMADIVRPEASPKKARKRR